MPKLHIVIKEKDSEPSIEVFDVGVSFLYENLKNIDWLYLATSAADAKVAIDNLTEIYKGES